MMAESSSAVLRCRASVLLVMGIQQTLRDHFKRGRPMVSGTSWFSKRQPVMPLGRLGVKIVPGKTIQRSAMVVALTHV